MGGYDVARRVLCTKPPRPKCPGWIISKSYEMVGNVAWGEKLKQYIHPSDIRAISYINKARDWPSFIELKSGWVLEFKSWEQGRDAFQARSIGFAWFDEQFPRDVFDETFARTRDYNSPILATLTPIEPDEYLQEKYEQPPEDWEFFELDLEEQRESRGGHVSDEWIDAFIRNTPEQFRDVRVRGKFAGFEGAVFKYFRRDSHVIEPFYGNRPPMGGQCFLGIDWGFNNPFVCLWMHRDHDGAWTIYDEHYQSQQFLEYHAKKIHQRPKPDQGIARVWADTEDAEARAVMSVKHGIVTNGANKDINAGIEEVDRLMMPSANGKPRIRVTRNCTNTIRELFNYRWESNATGRRNATDTPMDKDNHACDAMRYVIYSEYMMGRPMAPPKRIQGSCTMVRGLAKVMG